MEEGEHANAQNLYARVIAPFKNMTKKMRDGLDEQQKKKREEILHILFLNMSLCHLKKNKPQDAIKAATDSLEFNKENPKAYYRLAIAQKQNGDLDAAKENFVKAIKLAPSDVNLRNEYKQLTDFKATKESQWYSKMSGFLHSEKMAKIEQHDEEQTILREKLQRKHFGI